MSATVSLDGIDPISYQVLSASYSGIVQEMQNALFRTGYSTIIRESQDASCAIMDSAGELVAQHVVLPLHMGAFPACTRAVVTQYGEEIRPGDAFLINHPYEGGSPHAPDFTVIVPFFWEGKLLAFLGSMAHKSDIGGPVPGSCSASATEIFNEGLHLPAVRLEVEEQPVEDLLRIIAANSRTPEMVLGDIRGQVGCVRLGVRRLSELAEKHGGDRLRSFATASNTLTEKRVRDAIRSWPDGSASAERHVDDDGIDVGVPVKLHVEVTVDGDTLIFDFSDSSAQTRGPANIRPPLLDAACAYVMIALIDPQLEVNAGLFNSFEARTIAGTVVNPYFPAAVNTYNPTVHAVIDAAFDALSQIIQVDGRADGCASRSFVAGGRNLEDRRYVQYEIFGGGSGATASNDGVSGTTVNQTNGRIAPIEIVESEFPVRLRRFELVTDSGGPGTQRGGLAFLREYEQLRHADFALRSTRHEMSPLGAQGGGPGETGSLHVSSGGKQVELAARTASHPLNPGDVFCLVTPGGGGYGSPLDRDPDRVLDDVRNRYVSLRSAESNYGVIIEEVEGQLVINRSATDAQRKSQLR